MADPLDWSRFLRVVHRHRIEALVWSGLRQAGAEIPKPVGEALAGRAGRIALDNLRLAAEEARLHAAFTASGLDPVFVKGTTCALLAYGSLAVKTAWDIDLLVARSEVDSASALLVGLGYERIIPDPALSGAKLRRWIAHSREMLWLNRSLGIHVELHFALVDNPHLLARVSMGSPRQWVQHGDAIRLPTLANEELFAYLCVHGTMHLWARLKWLADVAAFIEAGKLDPLRLYRASLDLGAGRCAAVALILCNRMFATALPPELAGLRDDPAVAALERRSLAAMRRCETRADDTESAWEMLNIAAAGFLLMPGWRYALAELRARLFFPYSPLHLALWPALWPLLTMLQFPRFALKRMRLGRRPQEV